MGRSKSRDTKTSGVFIRVNEETEISSADLPVLLGVARRTVYFWTKTFGFPGTVRQGVFNLAEVMQWLVKAWRTSSKNVSKVDEEARKTRLQADKLELEVEERRGRLMERDAARRALAQAITEARGILEGLPARVAAEVPPEAREDVEDAVDRIVRLTLRALARGELGEGADANG